jgi:hypothetical protein
MPEDVKQYLESAQILDEYVPEAGVEVPKNLPWPDGVKGEAMSYMNVHWRAVLSHLDTVATNIPQQCAVIRACEGLGKQEYVSFLCEVRDLYIAKRINIRVFESALTPGLYKWGFLGTNNGDPEVRKFIESTREAIALDQDANHDVRNYLDSLLAGGTRRQPNSFLIAAAVGIAVLVSILGGVFFWKKRRL